MKTAANRIPKISMYLKTGMAVVLIILGIYHFTQPNAAWRSGTLESIFAVSLLAAAYLVSPATAVIINFIIAILMASLGIRPPLLAGVGYLAVLNCCLPLY